MPSDPTPDAEVLPYAPSNTTAGDLGAWVLRLFGIITTFAAASGTVEWAAAVVQWIDFSSPGSVPWAELLTSLAGPIVTSGLGIAVAVWAPWLSRKLGLAASWPERFAHGRRFVASLVAVLGIWWAAQGLAGVARVVIDANAEAWTVYTPYSTTGLAPRLGQAPLTDYLAPGFDLILGLALVLLAPRLARLVARRS